MAICWLAAVAVREDPGPEGRERRFRAAFANIYKPTPKDPNLPDRMYRVSQSVSRSQCVSQPVK